MTVRLGSAFLALTGSQVAAGVSTCVLRTAVAWHVLSQTGSAFWLAVLASSFTLVDVYCRPFLAALPDSFGPKRVYTLGLLTAIPFSLALLLLPQAGSVLVPLALVTTLPLALAAAVRDTTALVLTASLVQPANMEHGQSLRVASIAAVNLAGPLLAGGLVGLSNPHWAFGAAAGMLAFALAVFLRGTAAVGSEPKQVCAPLLRSAIESVQCVWRNPLERNVVLATGLYTNAVMSLVLVLLPAHINLQQASAVSSLAAVEASFGLGMLFSSFIVARWVSQKLGRFPVMAVALLSPLLPLLAMGALLPLWALCLCQGFTGVALAAFMVNVSTIRTLATPADVRSRLLNGTTFLVTCVCPLAALVSGALATWKGPASALAFCGIQCVAAALLLYRNRPYRTLSARPAADIQNAYRAYYPNPSLGKT